MYPNTGQGLLIFKYYIQIIQIFNQFPWEKCEMITTYTQSFKKLLNSFINKEQSDLDLKNEMCI